MEPESKLLTLRAEPFRLFFPLAFVLGAAGVAHWLLFTTGAITSYLGRFHAVTQTQAFLLAFAVGFLFTAVPKRTHTQLAEWSEIGVLLLLLPAVSVATLFEAEILGQAAYAAAVLVIIQFALRRFMGRAAGRRPPASFALVPVGLLAGLAGAAFTSVGLGEGAPAWVLGIGRRLVFEGTFTCLALGIGSFFLPLAGRGEAAPDLDKGSKLAVAAYAAAGLLVIAGLAVEVAGAARLGALLRGTVGVAVLAASGAWRAPSRPGANRWLFWAAVWAIPIGLLGAAAFPDHRVEALHVMFVGGFGLLAFAVGAHVILGHTGDEVSQAGRPWPVLAFGALFVVAMGLRVTALSVPEHYFAWLGMAAALWLAGATVWALFLFPRLRRVPETPRAPARGDEVAMLIQIGHREEPHADDLVGPLLDCHGRIRTFTAIAQRIAAGEGTPAEVADAAGRVEHYFRVALPLHVADEELSLRPRLLAAQTAPGVLLALDAMTGEHGAIEALVAALLPRWTALAERPSVLASLAPALAGDCADLRRRFDAHLEQEERMLFPAVRAHLGAAAPVIRAEMAARRRGAEPRATPQAPEASEPGLIHRLLADDHDRLEALLGRSVTPSGTIDADAYTAFRAGLARHIGMEEKILFAAVRRLGAGAAPAELARLREDHGNLVALLVPTPTAVLVGRIQAILEPHDAIEEGPGGVYDQCERLLDADAGAVLAQLADAPDVPMRTYYDGPLLRGGHNAP